MTDDLDAHLRAADPLRGTGAPVDLDRLRQRVDAERRGVVPIRRRPRPRARLALIAAAAAVITAVPLVLSVVGDDRAGAPPVLPVAVAGNGELVCGAGYASVVDPARAEVRLLPDELPPGWEYTEIFARHERSAGCDLPSLVALRLDPDGVVTGRVAVSGPVSASVDRQVLDRDTEPDTVFGMPARRFDYSPPPDRPGDSEVHRWVWTDAAGEQWSAAVVGSGLDEARRQLSGVSITGDAVAWSAVDPGWTVVHLRTGAPYVVPRGAVTWTVFLSGGVEGHGFDVDAPAGPPVPAAAAAWVGDRLVDLDGHAAVVSPARGGEAEGGAPGSVPLVTLAVEVGPGATAVTRTTVEDLAAVQRMLVTLRQVPADDPRIEQYGTR